MFRKSLTALLIGSWISLSGMDLVEDLDLSRQVSFGNIGNEFLTRVDGATDLTEPGEIANSLPSPLVVSAPVAECAVDKKAGKIHKLLRVFLI
jgi:hypothetical protein